jgi:hypothetical protein
MAEAQRFAFVSGQHPPPYLPDILAAFTDLLIEAALADGEDFNARGLSIV